MKLFLLILLATPLAAQVAVAPGSAAASPPAVASSSAPTIVSARKLVDTGHADEALTQIAAMRSANIAAPGLDRTAGLAYYAKGELKSADMSFAAALAKDPADVEASQMRGLTLFRLGRPADAIPLLLPSRANTSAQSKADPNYVLALCYIDTRRYDDARRSFAAQYGFPPESASAYLLTARMLLRREYLPVAQSYAEKAVALDATLPLAHELLGEIALAGNHLSEAIELFEQERAHNPLAAVIYDRLGDAYTRAARYDDAQRSLQEAILLEPNTTGPYILLGKTMLKKNDPLAAATYLEHANQLDPANYMTHSLLAQAYRGMGRRDDATREAATAQKIQGAGEPKLENVK